MVLGSAAVGALLLAAIVVTGCSGPHGAADGLVQVNGRLESDRVTLASKLAGRVNAIRAREGDSVQTGQILAVLDDKTTKAQLAEAKAAYETAQARVTADEVALEVMRAEVPNAIAAAEAGRAAAQAGLRKAERSEVQEQRDSDRASKLAEDHFVHPQTAERAALSWRLAQDQLAMAAAADDQAARSLRDARLGPARIRSKQAELASLEAAQQEAEARIAQVQSVLDDLTIASPIAGTVTARFVNVGEVVNAGTPMFELVDLDRLYLKVYVPEAQIGKVSLGLPARVYTDAFPDQPYPATVRYIASRAEFTPKEVQTPDERVKLVYEVRLYLDQNPGHRLTPGLPCDAVIRWKDNAEWQKPKW